MKRHTTFLLLILVLLVLLAVAAPVYTSVARAGEQSLSEKLQDEPLQLDVEAIRQARPTSCGEAAIVMAYNYINPEDPLTEDEVIAFAADQGYFTGDLAPFTSPADMVKIARYYGRGVSNGNVLTSDQGLNLLDRKLRDGVPVVIDVRTRFDDPDAGAHFVVVTGLSPASAEAEGVIIHYNDPLTGAAGAAPWEGEDGIWNAWKNNPDPGGSGWWMIIADEGRANPASQ